MTDIVFALLWPPLFAAAGFLVRRLTRGKFWRMVTAGTFGGGWAAGGTGVVIGYAGRDWLVVAIGAGQIALGVLLWWLSRRKRRRTVALLGAKSRAILARMADTMRRERKPSRILRPHPVSS